MAGNAADVLHQANGVGEGFRIDPLEDEPLGAVGALCEKGVVDVSFAVMVGVADHRPAKIKGVCGLLQQRDGDWLHDELLFSCYLFGRFAAAGGWPCRT